MKNKADIIPKEYPDVLIDIIEQLLFDPIRHTDFFRNAEPSLKHEILIDYIRGKIYDQQF